MIVNQLQSSFLMLFNILPNIIGALLVFFIGKFFAKLLMKLLQSLIEKLGIDQLAAKVNDIEFVRKTNVELKPSKLIPSIVYYFILLILFMIATDLIGISSITKLVSDLINYIPQALVAFVVLIIGVYFADVLKSVVNTTLKSLGIASATTLSNIVFYFVLINVLLISLKQAGIATDFLANNITSIIIGIVLAFSIGYGLASKDIISSYLASIYLKDKYRIGDIIGVDGIKGQIIQIDNTTFTLQSDEKRIVFPLSTFNNSKIELYSFRDTDIVNYK